MGVAITSERNGNEVVLCIQPYWSLTIRLFCVISRTTDRGVLLLSKDEVSIFYNLSRLDEVT